MITVYLNDKGVSRLPESFNELTPEQLLAIAPFVGKAEYTEAEKLNVCFLLMQTNLMLTTKETLKKNAYEFFADELRTKVLPLVPFLFAENKLTAQLLPVVSVGRILKKKFYGPSSQFNNLTLEEFSDAEDCLSHFEQTLDPIWISRFFAVLYRPGHPSHETLRGDARNVYNIHLNDKYGSQLMKLSEHHRAAILLWYQGCRAEVVSDYAFLFLKDKKDEAAQSSWVDVIHGMAGTKFGDIKATGRTLLKVILTEMRINYQNANQ